MTTGHQEQKNHVQKDVVFVPGASDEARTRYLHLGKVALYQMSYTRIDKKYNIIFMSICQQLFCEKFKIFRGRSAGPR